MSEPLDDRLLRQLEQLTAAGEMDEAGLHQTAEEEAALREGWSAFTRLLESANDDFDEAMLLMQVRDAIAEAKPHCRSRTCRGRQRAWRAALATAASLLIAVATWRFVADDDPRLATDERPDENTTAMQSASQAWDDAIDERLEGMSEQLIYAGTDWRGYDAPYAALDHRLQVLSETFDGEPL